MVKNTEGSVVDTIAPYDIASIDVGPRPFNIIFKEYPQVVPRGAGFSIIVSLWDAALHTIADPSIGLPHNITCSLNLIGTINLDGAVPTQIDTSSNISLFL